MSLDVQSNSNQPNMNIFIQSWQKDFSQPSLSCPATQVNSEKDNKIANNIGNNSAADFDGKNNLSYSYKVPDQLEVSIFLCIFLVSSGVGYNWFNFQLDDQPSETNKV